MMNEVQEKAFRQAVTLLEGMGSSYALVVPIKDGLFAETGEGDTE